MNTFIPTDGECFITEIYQYILYYYMWWLPMLLQEG